MKTGFTLIELLVVIVLLGIAIALVGPLTIEQVENSRARAEQQSLIRWLRHQSFVAFAKQQPLHFVFDGKAVYQAEQQYKHQQGTTEALIHYNYLFFQPQVLSFNSHGFTTAPTVNFTVMGRDTTLHLSDILAKNDE